MCHRSKYPRGNTRTIRHTDNRNLGLIAVSRHTGHHDPFHIGIFTCHERSLSFLEAGIDLHRNGIFRRKFDRADLQYLRAEARHLQHLFVRNLVESTRGRDDIGIGGVDPIDIRIDDTAIRLECRGQGDSGQIRSSSPKSRDV